MMKTMYRKRPRVDEDDWVVEYLNEEHGVWNGLATAVDERVADAILNGLERVDNPTLCAFRLSDVRVEAEDLGYDLSHNQLLGLCEFINKRFDASAGMNWERMQELIEEWCEKESLEPDTGA